VQYGTKGDYFLYVNNASAVYSVFLDASKAFDRIKYCKLFKILLGHKLSPVFVPLLLNMYNGHVARVLWNGIFSDKFSVYNGVKQGHVLSFVLFCLYTDGLLERLSHCKIGCNLVPCLQVLWHYADDIALLAPTDSAMHRLLKICDEYSNKYRVMFNGKNQHV